MTLLKRCARDITARRYQAAPYFEVYLDFAFGLWEESGSYMAWAGILDSRLVEELEEVRPIFGCSRRDAQSGGTTMSAPRR